MIIKFKLFENYETIEELTIEKFSYWMIYGSQSNCIKILHKLRLKLYNDECNLYSIIEKIDKNIRDNTYPDIIGTIFCFQNESFVYGPVKTDFQKNEIIMSQLSNYNFKGEIKEVDGEIVVDTLEVYTNKYNL